MQVVQPLCNTVLGGSDPQTTSPVTKPRPPRAHTELPRSPSPIPVSQRPWLTPGSTGGPNLWSFLNFPKMKMLSVLSSQPGWEMKERTGLVVRPFPREEQRLWFRAEGQVAALPARRPCRPASRCLGWTRKGQVQGHVPRGSPAVATGQSRRMESRGAHAAFRAATGPSPRRPPAPASTFGSPCRFFRPELQTQKE